MAAIEVESIVEGLPGQAHAYEVLIDGQARGWVRRGETRIFEVSPGIHTVKLEVDANSPPPVKVVVGFGKTSLTCQTTAHRRFGRFSQAVTRTQILVREYADAPPPMSGGISWRGLTAEMQADRALAAVD